MNEDLISVRTATELRDILGPVSERARTKSRSTLHAIDRQWLAASPFCLMSTSDADGSCDVSPKGDPPGFTLVLDDTTIVVPERLGNRRADSFHNILENGHVGFIYFVPGRGDTLRINGRAQLLRGAPFFEHLIVNGHRPSLALLVNIDEIFFTARRLFFGQICGIRRLGIQRKFLLDLALHARWRTQKQRSKSLRFTMESSTEKVCTENLDNNALHAEHSFGRV